MIPTFRHECEAVCADLVDLLVAKNARYGDSALSPLRVFSRADPVERLRVRIDDKLSRLARGDGTGDEDAELDLLGYLILLRVARLRTRQNREDGNTYPWFTPTS